MNAKEIRGMRHKVTGTILDRARAYVAIEQVAQLAELNAIMKEVVKLLAHPVQRQRSGDTAEHAGTLPEGDAGLDTALVDLSHRCITPKGGGR